MGATVHRAGDPVGGLTSGRLAPLDGAPLALRGPLVALGFGVVDGSSPVRYPGGVINTAGSMYSASSAISPSRTR